MVERMVGKSVDKMVVWMDEMMVEV